MGLYGTGSREDEPLGFCKSLKDRAGLVVGSVCVCNTVSTPE